MLPFGICGRTIAVSSGVGNSARSNLYQQTFLRLCFAGSRKRGKWGRYVVFPVEMVAPVG